MRVKTVPFALIILFMAVASFAQTAGSQAGASSLAAPSVPPLVRFAGWMARPEGTADVTFSIYREQTGGEPLWQEVQLVVVDKDGRYVAVLGSGAPLMPDLFTSGEARWLGVRPGGDSELPRVLLVSVPYALKAGDAETIGGKPLSAFVLAGEATGVGSDGLTYVDARVLKNGLAAAVALPQGAGTPGYLGVFTDTTNLGNSAVFQSGARIGVNTTAPATAFHSVSEVAPGALFDVYSNSLGALPVVFRAARGTAASPSAVQTDDILGGLAVRGYGATAFTAGRGQAMFRAAENWTDTANGTYLEFTTTPIGSAGWVERMRITPAGYVGIGTATPGQMLSVAGTIESTGGGFKFPDGTTQATAGAEYTAGSGLSLAASVFTVTFGGTGVADAAARSDHQHDAAYVSLAGSYSNPAWLTALPVAKVAGAATLGANTFSGTQTITGGNLALPTTASAGAGVVTLGGQPFLHGYGATTYPNTFLGIGAGTFTGTGNGGNVGIGGQALMSNTSGQYNTGIGQWALASNTTGGSNVGVGQGVLYRNTTATFNTAVGYAALAFATSGGANAAFGAYALGNSTGQNNSAFGYLALSSTTEGNGNSAFGAGALQNANYMSGNSAFGHLALQANTTGGGNSAFGESSLWKNTTGYNNAAFGHYSLYANTEGNRNCALGEESMRANTSGSDNIGIGYYSLYHELDGSLNIGIGTNALSGVVSGSRNVGIGGGTGVVNGTDNTFVGYGAAATVDVTNATAIGANARVALSNALVLGGTGSNAVNVGIGTSAPNETLQVLGDIRVGLFSGRGCIKDYDGSVLVGTCSSDARLKTNVRPFGPVLGRLSGLRPVYFEWRAKEFPQYHFGAAPSAGLIAQDVERAFPEMVGTDANGFKTVNYTQLPLVALAAVSELKVENDALKAKLAELAERLAKLEAQKK